MEANPANSSAVDVVISDSNQIHNSPRNTEYTPATKAVPSTKAR